MKTDKVAERELGRISKEKLEEPWSDRDAQKQVLSNVLHGRGATTAQRKKIRETMSGRPLSALAVVVAEVLS